MTALRYLIWIAAFASILFASYSGLMALYSEPGDGGGGGPKGTYWDFYGYVNCGLDGMPGSAPSCVECKCVRGGQFPSCTEGTFYNCCRKGSC